MSDTKKGLYKNPLEALRELGWEAAQKVTEESSRFVKTAHEQISSTTKSGEIMPGESLEMSEVTTVVETQKKDEERLLLQRRLIEEDKVFVERRTNELRIQIQAIHEEVIKIAEVTPKLNQEIEIAAFQAPADPSAYELYFLERLFEYIRSFRKKIENACVWLEVSNKRARKRNVWGANFKKNGAKYLLSGEHYASRSSA